MRLYQQWLATGQNEPSIEIIPIDMLSYMVQILILLC
jgi:hypothetical protein